MRLRTEEGNSCMLLGLKYNKFPTRGLARNEMKTGVSFQLVGGDERGFKVPITAVLEHYSKQHRIVI